MFLTAINDRPFNFLYVDIKKQCFYSGFLKKLTHKMIEPKLTEKIEQQNIEKEKSKESL